MRGWGSWAEADTEAVKDLLKNAPWIGADLRRRPQNTCREFCRAASSLSAWRLVISHPGTKFGGVFGGPISAQIVVANGSYYYAS